MPASYTVSGTVSGLAPGYSLVLADNGADTLTVTANGPFTFKSAITQNDAYSVTVGSIPMSQTCAVTFGTGSAIAANVTNVSVVCARITKSWVSTAAMSEGRGYFSAVPLADGTVLVAGGLRYSQYVRIDIFASTSASAELYNAATGSWASAGNMTTERQQHTATVLPNGSVLVAGGQDWRPLSIIQTTLATAEIYDPVGGTWTATASMTVGRVGHTATLLANGTVLIVGGDAVGNSAEIYDPTAASWIPTGSASVGFFVSAAVLLPNGKVLVTGARASGDTSEIFDPSTGTWASTGTNDGGQTATLLANGTVLVVGGGGGNGAEIYDPAADSWTPTASMTMIRLNYTATLLTDGTVLVAGGHDGAYRFTASAEIYHPASGTWILTGNMNTTRWAPAATLLPDGTVLAAGGLVDDSYVDNYRVVHRVDGLASAEIYYP